MLDYEDFYFQIWNYFISESDVSFDYREENIDFIRAVSFSFFKEYEKNNVNVSVYGKVLKIFFSNLLSCRSTKHAEKGNNKNNQTNKLA